MMSTKTRARHTIFCAMALALAGGCSFAPPYERPVTEPPAAWRTGNDHNASLANLPWWAIYGDPALQELIRVALAQNKDAQIAITRVAQARAEVGIVGAAQAPQLDAGASVGRSRNSARTHPTYPPPYVNDNGTAAIAASFELDLWGRLRNATDAARANLLATEDAQRTVVITLVAEVAQTYFELRARDQDLAIAQQTATTRAESLRIVQSRYDRGVAGALDLAQAQRQYQGAVAAIPLLQRDVAETENRLSILLGRNPGPIVRGIALEAQPLPPEVPAGLPSAILEQRPDLRAAEQRIVAANARIGEAKALYFPQIALTASYGSASTALGNLFTGPAATWNGLALLAMPIFDAGRIGSTVDLATARQQEAILAYQQVVQQAFREVDDALVGHQKTRESRAAQVLVVAAAQRAFDSAEKRYLHGVTSYLDVLDAQRELFNAQIALTRVEQQQLVAVVQIYRALGGGWVGSAGWPTSAPLLRCRGERCPEQGEPMRQGHFFLPIFAKPARLRS